MKKENDAVSSVLGGGAYYSCLGRPETAACEGSTLFSFASRLPSSNKLAAIFQLSHMPSTFLVKVLTYSPLLVWLQ